VSRRKGREQRRTFVVLRRCDAHFLVESEKIIQCARPYIRSEPLFCRDKGIKRSNVSLFFFLDRKWYRK
jgi:hypothetical protein